ncbi:hypothetical protein FRB90_000229 [Tulasnella sp. 427]|nr:hypothetical protein FRB90_000229 [Tulasnella sp. 427]
MSQENRQKRAIILIALADYVEKARVRHGSTTQKATAASELASVAARLVILMDDADELRDRSNSPLEAISNSTRKPTAGQKKGSRDQPAGSTQQKQSKPAKPTRVNRDEEADTDEGKDNADNRHQWEEDEEAEPDDGASLAKRSSARQALKTNPKPKIANAKSKTYEASRRRAKRLPLGSDSSEDDGSRFFIDLEAPSSLKRSSKVQLKTEKAESKLKARANTPAIVISSDEESKGVSSKSSKSGESDKSGESGKRSKSDGSDDKEDRQARSLKAPWSKVKLVMGSSTPKAEAEAEAPATSDDDDDSTDQQDAQPPNRKVHRPRQKLAKGTSEPKGKGKARARSPDSDKMEAEVDELEDDELPAPSPPISRKVQFSQIASSSKHRTRTDSTQEQQEELEALFALLCKRKDRPTIEHWMRFGKLLDRSPDGPRTAYTKKANLMQGNFPRPINLDSSPLADAFRDAIAIQLDTADFPRPKWLESE